MIIYYTDKFAGGREESRMLLKEALALYTGDEEQAKTLIGALKKGEHGKPYIEGFSCFSVSHTGSIWAVLFADRECGLDIQAERKCDIMAISGRFYDPEDAAFIASLCGEGTEGASTGSKEYSLKAMDSFFRVWTRREALIKALGSSVSDTDLPAVLPGKAEAGGKQYFITDIGIPAAEGADEDTLNKQGLYAALCIEGYAIDAEPEIYRF